MRVGLAKRVRRRGAYLLLAALSAVVGRLPFWLASDLGAAAGVLAWWSARRPRGRALANLELALGDRTSPGERRRVARAVFRHFGRTAAECLVLPRLSRAAVRSLVDDRDFERRVAALRSAGHGVVMCTAHLGNWELLGAFAASHHPATVVARRIYYEPYNRRVEAMRTAHGLKTIYQDASPREVLRALGRNEMVGVLPDQDVPELAGVWAPFFGREAWTPRGVAQVAALAGAPLVPIYLLRRGRRFELVMHEPVPLASSGDREADALENTRRWTAVLESEVRAAPEQWPWFHPRWKSTPDRVARHRGRAAAARGG
ncbi:MAG: lysophospholipid acyltransferase family protein [Planctomycetes bacterium]|nr:lysophospholipid acyltransferase family protein [Planctomycetota bacterium]